MKKPDHLVRYRAPERINHWIVAICFVMAALSGLGFFFPSFNWLMQIFGTPQLARILHPFVGVVMFVAFMLMFLRYWKHNLINRDDLYWARNIHRGELTHNNFARGPPRQSVNTLVNWRLYHSHLEEISLRKAGTVRESLLK